MATKKCDLCGQIMTTGYYVDGVTVMGCWADMCKFCFEQTGVGLGTGRGQVMSVETGELVKVQFDIKKFAPAKQSKSKKEQIRKFTYPKRLHEKLVAFLEIGILNVENENLSGEEKELLEVVRGFLKETKDV